MNQQQAGYPQGQSVYIPQSHVTMVPPQQQQYGGTTMNSSPSMADSTAQMHAAYDLIPCCGSVCAIFSCFCEFPNCIGCSGKGVICCLEQELNMCRCAMPSDTFCFLCLTQSCLLVQPTICCKCFGHFCCLDGRCAFPFDDEIPCVCTLLPFCVACAKWQVDVTCFAKIKELKGYPKVVPL